MPLPELNVYEQHLHLTSTDDRPKQIELITVPIHHHQRADTDRTQDPNKISIRIDNTVPKDHEQHEQIRTSIRGYTQERYDVGHENLRDDAHQHELQNPRRTELSNEQRGMPSLKVPPNDIATTDAANGRPTTSPHRIEHRPTFADPDKIQMTTQNAETLVVDNDDGDISIEQRVELNDEQQTIRSLGQRALIGDTNNTMPINDDRPPARQKRAIGQQHQTHHYDIGPIDQP